MSDMPEHQFTEMIEALATELGLLTHFCGDARRCRGRGFPDLVIAGRFGIIFAELKVGNNETSPLQNLWLWTLDEATGRSAVAHVVKWRPADLASGLIRSELEMLTRNDPDRHRKRPRTNNVRRRSQFAGGVA